MVAITERRATTRTVVSTAIALSSGPDISAIRVSLSITNGISIRQVHSLYVYIYIYILYIYIYILIYFISFIILTQKINGERKTRRALIGVAIDTGFIYRITKTY